MADEWEKMARPSDAQRSAKTMRKTISDLHQKYVGNEMPKTSARAFFAQWLGTKEGELSPSSYTAYESATRHFLEFIGDAKADGDMFVIAKPDISSFRDAEVKRTTASNANKKLKILRMAFKAAADDEWIPESPAKGIKVAKGKQKAVEEKRRPYSIDELRRLFGACPTDEWKDMVVRAFFNGQRLKDIALMISGQEDLVNQVVRFQTSKTGKIVILPMSPAYVEYVLQRPASDDPFTPLHPVAHALVTSKMKAGKSAVTTMLSNRFAKILIKAGLREKAAPVEDDQKPGRRGKKRGYQLAFHSLRHSFVSALANAGVGKAVLMDLVGHSSAQINDMYTHIDPSLKKDAMEKMPTFLN